jgi:hypothetical protein
MNLTDNSGQFLYGPGESDNRYSLDACLHASILAYRDCDPCKWRAHVMLRFYFIKIPHTQERLS